MVVGQYLHWPDKDPPEQRGPSLENFPRDLNFFFPSCSRREKGYILLRRARELSDPVTGKCRGNFRRSIRSDWQKAKLEEIVRIMPRRRGTIDESSRAFPERALLIGKSWSLWMNTKCQVFSSFERRDHTLLFKRVDDVEISKLRRRRKRRPGVKGSGGKTILTFVSPLQGSSMRYFANGEPFVVQRFGPCRHVTSRMASTMLFTSRVFPPFFSLSSPFRAHFPFNARFSPDCAVLARRDFTR